MKIAQLAANYYKSGPEQNSAIYSHVSWLTNGLVSHNNDVHLFATKDSETMAKLHSVTETGTWGLDISDEMRRYLLHALMSDCYRKASEFDIIHTHLTLWPSFYSGLTTTPTIQSLHSPVDPTIYEIMKRYDNQYFVSFSQAQRKHLPDLNWVANVYHGVDTQLFGFNPHPKDYLLYLGRITEEKGVHFAVEAAKAANMPLIIAGFSYQKEGYWHDKIEKQIDGNMIRYVGEANLATKIEYLKNAKALLFPTQYDEVFGLVMIEAMACGTPVIGWRKGSVPEVIKDKLTGYVVNDVQEMIKAIGSIDKISRDAARDRAIKLFSVETMVTNYERAYLKVIEEHRAKHAKQKTA